jgi:ribosomal-protein-alanine N-acetyltransferase
MTLEQARIRAGVAQDVQALVAIEREAAISPWSLNQFLSSSLRDNEHTLVLEDGAGVVAGFCIYRCLPDEASLMNIAVRPARQGTGLGRQLLSRLQQTLLGLGVKRCLLEVRRGNKAAIALYRNLGFVDDSVRKDYYPTESGREDALLMSCQLVNKR